MADRDFTVEYKWWDIPEKLVKLEQAFAIGCTDKEACSYAEITLDQLYYYTREINKAFQAKKEELKEKPILKARQTIVNNLDNPTHAAWYLERRKKDEFSTRQEQTGADGKDLILKVVSYSDEDNGNQNPVQLDTRETPTTSTEGQGEIQSDSMAPQGSQDDVSPEQADTTSLSS